MALVPNQPPAEMRTRDLPGVRGRPVLKADNLTAVYESII
jgi:hypothetical protein